MNELQNEIKKINMKLDEIEEMLKKPSREWSEDEREEYGNHQELRKEKARLGTKEEQLRELQILKEKEKSEERLGERGPGRVTQSKVVILTTRA